MFPKLLSIVLVVANVVAGGEVTPVLFYENEQGDVEVRLTNGVVLAVFVAAAPTFEKGEVLMCNRQGNAQFIPVLHDTVGNIWCADDIDSPPRQLIGVAQSARGEDYMEVTP
jgi:hypothetical protein